MHKKIKISLITILLLVFQITFSQVDDDLVQLDEVVLTLPFGQTLGKSVLKVDKLNFNDINPIIKQYISNSISKLPGVSIISTGAGIGKPSIRGLSSNRVVVLNQGLR
jgi:Outer membrane cobalamin receptor protein